MTGGTSGAKDLGALGGRTAWGAMYGWSWHIDATYRLKAEKRAPTRVAIYLANWEEQRVRLIDTGAAAEAVSKNVRPIDRPWPFRMFGAMRLQIAG